MPTHNINIRQMPLHKRGGPVIALSLRRPDEYTHAIVEEGRRRGWTLADLRLCGGRPPPGLVCQGAIVSDMPDSGLVAALRQTGCTVVRLGRLPHPQDASLPAVLSDFAAAGRLAAEHFSERQFSHVGYVGFQPWSDAKGLYDAFHAQAIALGMESHLLRFKSKPGKSEQGKPVGGSRPSDAEKWLMHISHLKGDPFRHRTPRCQHQTCPFSQVRDVGTIRNFVRHARLGLG